MLHVKIFRCLVFGSSPSIIVIRKGVVLTAIDDLARSVVELDKRRSAIKEMSIVGDVVLPSFDRQKHIDR